MPAQAEVARTLAVLRHRDRMMYAENYGRFQARSHRSGSGSAPLARGIEKGCATCVLLIWEAWEVRYKGLTRAHRAEEQDVMVCEQL